MFKLRYFLLFASLTTAAEAQITGDFSRANCVTNNESITFLPGNPFLRGVISWHRPTSGFLHYAGHEDPVSCAGATCPTSPNVLEDAICYTFDACLWPLVTHPITGRWAGIHNLYGLDKDTGFGTGPWTVEGRHTVFYGYYYGIPIYTINQTGPVTDCSL